MNPNTDDTISALADGQLAGAAFASALERLSRDPESVAAWEAYHLVGDVMRHGTSGAPLLDRGFAARLSQRLATEGPLVTQVADPGVNVLPEHRASRPSANQEVFYRRIVAGLTVIGLGCWAALGSWRSSNESDQVAATSVVAPVAGEAVGSGSAMIRDARLDELLAAHRQAGGATALQMPSGFLRNATFQGSAR